MPTPPKEFYVLNSADHTVPVRDEDEWIKWMLRHAELLAVAETQVEMQVGSVVLVVNVSTAFIGLDEHPEGPPRPWQTRVMGGPTEGVKRRYRTRAEALRGHEEVVKRMEAAGKKGSLNGRT